MLKHVGQYRSTTSLARASSSSLQTRPGDSASCRTPGEDDEDSISSPEVLRRSLSSPGSYGSDSSSPESPKKVLSHAKDPKGGEVPEEDAEVSQESCKKIPATEDSQEKVQECEEESKKSCTKVPQDTSSPEVPKKDLARPSTLPRRAGHRPPDDLPPHTGQPIRKVLKSSESCSLHSSSTSILSLTPSRSSSTSSLVDPTMTPVKVYLRFMRPDMEYKTLSLSSGTTCRQLVLMLLAKFRLRHRDPNLFFVTMEVTLRTPGAAPPRGACWCWTTRRGPRSCSSAARAARRASAWVCGAAALCACTTAS
ncbi:uncharacterized protein LOC135112678 [Scylla paramamosain]|uniref:uncharacterized protein LOC135112678 n=1 Tax=Scylla paramamosain TaxID=85552 RepID=UPI003083495C